MDTSEKLLTARKQSGLSREQVGRKLGVHRNTVYKWEAKKARPPAKAMPILAQAYGKPVSYFLEDETETPPGDNPAGPVTGREALTVRIEKLRQHVSRMTVQQFQAEVVDLLHAGPPEFRQGLEPLLVLTLALSAPKTQRESASGDR